MAGGLNLYGFAAGDPVNFSDPSGLCPPEDTNDGPDCKVAFIGVSLSFYFVLGGEVAFGRYISAQGEGTYFKLGLGAGFEAGGVVEGGESRNRAAMSGGGVEAGGGALFVNAARSWNNSGKTNSLAVGAGLKPGGHVALTATAVSKPEPPPDLRPNFDCSKPHPHNHVCNQ